MKEKKETRLWGPTKREPNERGQTDDRPHFIEKPVAEALFACRHAAREKGEGKAEEEKRRRKEETKVFPATTQASKGTPKKEELPAMTKASRDTRGRRKGKERKKDTEREREREREKSRASARARVLWTAYWALVLLLSSALGLVLFLSLSWPRP